MCELKLLVVGDSDWMNKFVIKQIVQEFDNVDNVKISKEVVTTEQSYNIDPESYDLAIVDDTAITKYNLHNVLCSGIPVLTFKDIVAISPLVRQSVRKAIETGKLRDHIIKTTEHIDETHKMLAMCAF